MFYKCYIRYFYYVKKMEKKKNEYVCMDIYIFNFCLKYTIKS